MDVVGAGESEKGAFAEEEMGDEEVEPKAHKEGAVALVVRRLQEEGVGDFVQDEGFVARPQGQVDVGGAGAGRPILVNAHQGPLVAGVDDPRVGIVDAHGRAVAGSQRGVGEGSARLQTKGLKSVNSGGKDVAEGVDGFTLGIFGREWHGVEPSLARATKEGKATGDREGVGYNPERGAARSSSPDRGSKHERPNQGQGGGDQRPGERQQNRGDEGQAAAGG